MRDAVCWTYGRWLCCRPCASARVVSARRGARCNCLIVVSRSPVVSVPLGCAVLRPRGSPAAVVALGRFLAGVLHPRPFLAHPRPFGASPAQCQHVRCRVGAAPRRATGLWRELARDRAMWADMPRKYGAMVLAKESRAFARVCGATLMRWSPQARHRTQQCSCEARTCVS